MTASQTDAFLRLQEAYERCATHWERQQMRDAMDRILAQSDAVPPASSHRP